MLKKLLQTASLIEVQKRERTIFDIAEYAHYENVVSNILRFFFDATEEHAFGDLWTKSLLNCYSHKRKKKIEITNCVNVEPVVREISTENKKRIDLIIPLEEYTIGIENKIFSSVYNPFEEYHNKIIERGKKPIEILLTLREEVIAENGGRFINITYDELIQEIELNYKKTARKDKWTFLMEEFISNIKNLKGVGRINMEWQQFINENRYDFQRMIEKYFNDIECKRVFIKTIKSELDKLLSDSFEYNVYLPSLQNGAKHFSVWINVQNAVGDKIAIETYIDKTIPTEITLTLWNRKKGKSADFQSEREWLKEKFSQLKECNESFWGKHLTLKTYKFGSEKNFTENDIAKEMFEIATLLKDKYPAT